MRIPLFFLLAAVATTLPFWVVTHLGGDAPVHFTFMQCFDGQLWQGDPYPRWCFDADAGLGSPAFFFYFPLPYLLTAPLYPLVWAGGSIQLVYMLMAGLSMAVGGFACFLWLREVVGEKPALLAALLYMLLPYRIDVTFWRAAFAEGWCMAFVPLICLFARRLALAAHVRWMDVAGMAMAILLSLLCETQVTVGVLAGLGVYMLIVLPPKMLRDGRPLMLLALACAVAVAGAAFYLLPAWEFLPFVQHGSTSKPPPNTVILPSLAENYRQPTLIGLAITLIGLTWLASVAWRRRTRLPAVIRREALGWAIAACISFYAMMPWNLAFWNWFNSAAPIIFPWRLQLVIMLAAVYLAAVYMAYLLSPRARKTWKADYAMFCISMVMLSFFLLSERPHPRLDEITRVLEPAHYVRAEEYRTIWMSDRKLTVDEMYALQLARPHSPNAVVAEGKAQLEVKQWRWDGIVLDVRTSAPATVRLRQRYFPCWKAQLDGQPAPLLAEQGSGLMEIRVPPGAHTVLIRRWI